jgi:hypothetical protein
MAALIFRCPATGVKVQAWFADDASVDNGEIYESLTCPACSQVHLINRSTGRALGVTTRPPQLVAYHFSKMTFPLTTAIVFLLSSHSHMRFFVRVKP